MEKTASTYLSTSEAAEVLGRPVEEIYRLIYAGCFEPGKELLKCEGTYMFPKREIEAIRKKVETGCKAEGPTDLTRYKFVRPYQLFVLEGRCWCKQPDGTAHCGNEIMRVDPDILVATEGLICEGSTGRMSRNVAPAKRRLDRPGQENVKEKMRFAELVINQLFVFAGRVYMKTAADKAIDQVGERGFRPGELVTAGIVAKTR